MKRCCFIALVFALPLFLPAQKNNPPNAAEPKATPAADRLASLEKRKQTEARSILTNVEFRNVGPTVMSGRVVDICVNPSDPTIFYVAYASGGVWLTENNGTTFRPVFDSEATLDIGAIAVNWDNPAVPELWVGTGESNSSRSSYAGSGIYHSMDGGKTWANKGLAETHHIGRIIISPRDRKTIWVAAIGHLYSPNKERGVYRSMDGGETWGQTLFIDENTGVIDLYLAPDSAKILYAVAWHRERKPWNFVEGGINSGLYMSTNGGGSFFALALGNSGFPQGEGIGRIGLAFSAYSHGPMYAIVDNQTIVNDSTKKKTGLSPADFRLMTREQFLALDQKLLQKYLEDNGFPDKYTAASVTAEVRSNKIQPVALADYVSDANADLFNKPIIGAEIYRSDDAGASWKKVNTKPLTNLFYTYGYYFGKIWVSPFDENELFIAGVELLKSKDGGKTFQSTNGENQHGDHHALWIDPKRKGHLVNGNDGGVNISWDDGATWFKANTPAVGQFYSVNVDMAQPYNVYGGLQDNGVWCGPSNYTAGLGWYDDGEYPYKRVLGGDGMQVQVDTRDNNLVYCGFQFGHYFRVNKQEHSEKQVYPEIELGEQPLRFNWQAPILLSPHNQDILYIGAQKLYRSFDQGDHFTAISGDLTRGAKTGDVPYGTLTTVAESPLKFGLLYTGSDDGLIHVSKDGGESWKRISDKLPQNLRVNRVIASSHEEGRVYAVLSGFQFDHFQAYVFVSEDYGENWTQIGLDLPMEPVNVIREDPVNASLLFVGTDGGLYTSIDRGKSFMRMFNGLPSVAVHDLMIQTREHDLVVGTHGRSIYIAHIEALEQLNDSILAQNLFVYEAGTIVLQPAYLEINGEFKQVSKPAAHLAWYSKQAGPTLIRIKSADEKYTFSTIHDTSEVGLNFLDTDLPVDSANVPVYKKWLREQSIKEEPVIFGHGQCFLLPGDYVIEIENAGIKKTIKIKLVKPVNRGTVPNSPESPGEFNFYQDK